MKIFLTIFQILLVFLLIGAGLVVVTSKTDRVAGIQSMVVLTGSMGPAIPAGGMVMVRPGEWYFPGDVLTFRNAAGQTVTHRLQEKLFANGEAVFRMKGDANNTADSELVPPGQVVGRVFAIVPYVGHVVLALKTLPGFLSLVVLPALIFVGYELWGIKKEIVRETEKRLLKSISSDPNVRIASE